MAADPDADLAGLEDAEDDNPDADDNAEPDPEEAPSFTEEVTPEVFSALMAELKAVSKKRYTLQYVPFTHLHRSEDTPTAILQAIGDNFRAFLDPTSTILVSYPTGCERAHWALWTVLSVIAASPQ